MLIQSICRKSHKETFGFVVVSNGLFNAPLHPEWAQGLVSAKPKDDNSLWIVDGKDYNDASVAKVGQGHGIKKDCEMPGVLLQIAFSPLIFQSFLYGILYSTISSASDYLFVQDKRVVVIGKIFNY